MVRRSGSDAANRKRDTTRGASLVRHPAQDAGRGDGAGHLPAGRRVPRSGPARGRSRAESADRTRGGAAVHGEDRLRGVRARGEEDLRRGVVLSLFAVAGRSRSLHRAAGAVPLRRSRSSLPRRVVRPRALLPAARPVRVADLRLQGGDHPARQPPDALDRPGGGGGHPARGAAEPPRGGPDRGVPGAALRRQDPLDAHAPGGESGRRSRGARARGAGRPRRARRPRHPAARPAGAARLRLPRDAASRSR